MTSIRFFYFIALLITLMQEKGIKSCSKRYVRGTCRVSRTKPVRLRFKKEKKVEDTLARVEPKDNDCVYSTAWYTAMDVGMHVYMHGAIYHLKVTEYTHYIIKLPGVDILIKTLFTAHTFLIGLRVYQRLYPPPYHRRAIYIHVPPSLSCHVF